MTGLEVFGTLFVLCFVIALIVTMPKKGDIRATKWEMKWRWSRVWGFCIPATIIPLVLAYGIAFRWDIDPFNLHDAPDYSRVETVKEQPCSNCGVCDDCIKLKQ